MRINLKAFVLGLVLVLPLTLNASAQAAPKGGGGSTYLSFIALNPITYGVTSLNFGYSVDRKVDRAHVLIECWNAAGGDVPVYAEAAYVESPGQGQVTFHPGNPDYVWSRWDTLPGDATCEAGLYRWGKERRVDTRVLLAGPITFQVDDPRA